MRSLVNPTHSFQPFQKTHFLIAERGDKSFDYRLRSSWQFRIYAQMLYRQSMGYNAYFLTLTYANSSLPYIRVVRYSYTKELKQLNPNLEDVTICTSCFRNTDLQRFCRGLQNDLLRLYDVTDIDYIICPEYGKKGTCRPHYHAVLLVPNNVTPEQLLALCKKHWSIIVPNLFNEKGAPIRKPIGWVLPDKSTNSYNNGRLQKPFQIAPKQLLSAAIYVSKYCSKQMDFYNKTEFREIQSIIKNSLDMDKKKELSNAVPRLKVSLHFGECINDLITFDNTWWKPYFKPSEISYDTLYYGLWTPLSKKHMTSIPFYNRRKLLYEKVEQSLVVDVPTNEQKRGGCKPRYTYQYKFTDFAKKYIPYEFNLRKKDILTNIEDFCVHYLHSIEFRNFWNSCNIDNLTLSEFISKFDNVNRELLAVYSLCYQDRVSLQHYIYYLQNPGKFEPYEVHFENYITSYKCFYSYADRKYHYERVGEIVNSYSLLLPCNYSFVLPCDSFVPLGLPSFFGDEDADTLISRSYNLYCYQLEYLSNPHGHEYAPSEVFSIHFNSFPCFRGFDILLLLMKEFMMHRNDKKIRSIENAERIHKEIVDNYWQ